MGTRCLTVLYDNDWANKPNVHKEIAVLYRQFDGYPEGHGEELKKFLDGMKIVNGIGLDNKDKIANGGSCLAAQIVAHFKEDVGQFYLYPAGTRNCGEEYVYEVYPKHTGKVVVVIKDICGED